MGSGGALLVPQRGPGRSHGRNQTFEILSQQFFTVENCENVTIQKIQTQVFQLFVFFSASVPQTLRLYSSTTEFLSEGLPPQQGGWHPSAPRGDTHEVVSRRRRVR